VGYRSSAWEKKERGKGKGGCFKTVKKKRGKKRFFLLLGKEEERKGNCLSWGFGRKFLSSLKGGERPTKKGGGYSFYTPERKPPPQREETLRKGGGFS